MNIKTLTTLSLASLLAVAAAAYADEPKNDPKAPAPPAPVSPYDDARPPRSLVVHVPPIVAEPDRAIELEAMIDSPLAETLSVSYRRVGEVAWHDALFERSSAGGWYASLPGTRTGGVEYFIHGRDATGGDVLHFASAESPHVVRVDPTLVDRLETLDRDRLDNHTDQVALEIAGHNFGNRYKLADHFVRAELGYTHRLWRIIHQISFGFGSISGKTPAVSEPGGAVDGKALRYGYGELRLRVHPSVFLDARASLGVSQEGFDQGVRGQVTFGKPWRACVQVGGEALRDLGDSAWVRLQWDSAPPFLMGAQIMRTDLPGAEIDSSGLYLGYDVSYLVANTFTIKAQLSYGSRDGAANFGGGIGTAVDF